MTAIDVTGLTKEFGDVTAVNELSFSVESGEVFGFLGPNGAGKSTTINLLLGYVSPTSGTATVLGHDVEAESRTLRERVGVLPENVGVYDRLTAHEHVASAVRIKDGDDSPDELLSRVGLAAEAWDRAAGGFSTGMKQRLALATALAGDPDLLVLDEPQSGLDPNGMQEIREVVLDVAADGTTVFFSSHILPEVHAVSDRIGVMRGGEMAAVDTIDSLQAQSETDIVLTVQILSPPADRTAVTDLDGVRNVTVDGDQVSVTCRDPRTKGQVIAALERTVGVADFEVDEGSLEDVFAELTGQSVEDEGDTTADITRNGVAVSR